MEKVRYIHYGSDKFEKWKFHKIRNPDWGNKPLCGGLWASRVNADYDWKEWCEKEGFRTERLLKSFTFTLSDNARIFEIHSVKDADFLPTFQSKLPTIDEWVNPDFEELIRRGYDGIEFFLSEDFELYWKLYGWSCDSILIMNKDIIIPE